MLKPFDWSGTATRANYWILLVSLIIAVICLYVLPSDLPIFGVILLAVAVLQMLMVSVAVRRLHDFGRSGMWVILMLVPFVELVASLWIGWAKGKPEQATAWPGVKITIQMESREASPPREIYRFLNFRHVHQQPRYLRK
jgi:hypothetical protein